MKYEDYKDLLLNTHGSHKHIKREMDIFIDMMKEDPEITEKEYEELFAIAEEVYGYPL